MGRGQGEALRDKIRGARAVLGRIEAFRLDQPAWLPYPVYRLLAERRARRLLSGPLQRRLPRQRERLEGIAEGAGLPARALYLMNCVEAFLSSVPRRRAAPAPGACSAMAVRGARSAEGEPFLVRNFDYLEPIRPFQVVRESRPAGGLRSLDFAIAPLAGAADGINEAGLCITYNYGYTADEPPEPAPPISMAVADALARCSTAAEAAERIASGPRWGGGLLMLADAGGDIAALELSNTRSVLRRPAPGEDLLAHTNAFLSPEMQEVQVPESAVFGPLAPKTLRGRRVLESAEVRRARLLELLSGAGPLSFARVAAAMADHGPRGAPGDLTPCCHGSYWRTVASLAYFPSSRRMRVSFSTACEAGYEELAL